MSEITQERKVRRGEVVSDAMDKTIIVEIQRVVQDSLYGKRFRRNTRLKVHDEEESARVGDVVEVIETRPISKTKRWRLVEILEELETAAVELEQEVEVAEVEQESEPEAEETPARDVEVETEDDETEDDDPDAEDEGETA